MTPGALSMTQAVVSPEGGQAVAARRIVTIDALRGFVMLLMLVDHAREFFYMHAQ